MNPKPTSCSSRRGGIRKFFASKRKLNATPQGPDHKELHVLQARVELLHSLLPQEIVETIQNHWSHAEENKNEMINGRYIEADSLTYCSSSSLSSSSEHSIPQSIFIKQIDSNEIERTDEVRENSSLYSNEGSTSSTSSTLAKALYSEDVNDVSVVFVNIVDFCKISNGISSHQVLRMLQSLFRRFDTISKKYNILKLDTIGDSYLCCSGFSKRLDSDPLRVLEAAKEMVRVASKVPIPKLSPSSPQEYLSVRIGIHIGKATFGVLCQSLPKLVCVGSTVNMAARMEQTSAPNHIHVTHEFRDVIGEDETGWEFSETVKIKNMGQVEAYQLDPLKGEKESQWC